MPHGLVQLSPDNGVGGWDRIAGYYYPDSTIAGFSHTHLSGTGAGDLYDISFMPYCGEPRIARGPLGLHSRFSHDSEQAWAGYYRVTLEDYGIDVELTATGHVGLQRYTWPGTEGKVVLNLRKAMNWDGTTDTGLEVLDSVTVAGYRFSDGWARDQKVWFATRFSRPFTAVEIDSVRGHVATFTFATEPGSQLTVTTAISGTDRQGALANLRMEAPRDDFDHYRTEAEGLWNDKLDRIQVETRDTALLRTFYTALYHSLLCPVVFSDADGRYRGPDGQIHRVKEGHKHYSTFSLWDTYRAAHPLYTLIEPAEAADMAQSLVDFADQNGRLPVWNMWASETDMMIGYHSAPVIADAVLKGLPGVDAEKALELSVRTAEMDEYRSLGDYRRLGYVPADRDTTWSLSKTLEYAYDDYCISRLARHLGHDDIADRFALRAQNYRKLFDPGTGFFRPRNADGSWVEPFDPQAYTRDICESNAWHYLWSVQHDIPSLMELLGGRQTMERKLDEFFTTRADTASLPLFSTGMIGQYAHGNEPSHHVAYLYNAVGRPDKARHYLEQIMREQYSDTPAGLCGNEDCGQMSAWFVLSSLGFYPVDPLSGKWEPGVCLFDRVTLLLPNHEPITYTPDKPFTP